MLIVKDIEWTNSDDKIIIRVPFKRSISSEVNIVTHENYIKIHASPFFFEAFLLHKIDENESRCQLTSDEARFILKKSDACVVWEKLERDFCDKQEKVQVRGEILESIQQRENEKLKKKAELKDQIKRNEVQNSMAKDAEVRVFF